MRQCAPHLISPAVKRLEQLVNLRMVNGPILSVTNQVLLTDIGDIRAVVILGEQVVERLIAARPQVFRDRLVPLLAIGEDRVDVEHDAAKIVEPVANDCSNAEAGADMTGGINCASGLR